MFKALVLFLIRLYQKTLSFDHGVFSYLFPYGYCKFYPTCSEYAVRAVQTHGAGKGLVLAFLRIIRCNPFTAGGFDSIPR